MFHVLLALPAIAVFGTVAGTVLIVLTGLLGFAFFAELACGFALKTLKWLLWMPLILGVAVIGLLGIVLDVVPLTLILIFGILYGVTLLVGRCVVYLFRWLFSVIF